MPINFKRSSGGASHQHRPPATIVVANLFGKPIIAWANGVAFYEPTTLPTIKKRRHRTQYTNPHQYLLATQGY